MGINVVLMRLTIESIDATARSQLAATLHAAFSVCSSLVGFVESLTPTECSLFWMPCEPPSYTLPPLPSLIIQHRLIPPRLQHRLPHPPHRPPLESRQPGLANVLQHPSLPPSNISHRPPLRLKLGCCFSRPRPNRDAPRVRPTRAA